MGEGLGLRWTTVQRLALLGRLRLAFSRLVRTLRISVAVRLQPGCCRVVGSGYSVGAGSTPFAATWVRAGGAKLDAIADMLGHSSTTTTQVYAQIVDRMSENPAKYLEAAMKGQKAIYSIAGKSPEENHRVLPSGSEIRE